MKKYDAVGAVKRGKGHTEKSVTVEGKPLQTYLKTIEERAYYVIDELDARDLLRFAGILVGIACIGKDLAQDDPLRSYDILGLVGYWMRPRDITEDPSFL
jgi:hypothetical protein